MMQPNTLDEPLSIFGAWVFHLCRSQDGLRLFGRAPVAGNTSRTAGRWASPESSPSHLVVFVKGWTGDP